MVIGPNLLDEILANGLRVGIFPLPVEIQAQLHVRQGVVALQTNGLPCGVLGVGGPPLFCQGDSKVAQHFG